MADEQETLLTIEELAQVLECDLGVAQTIHARGILPHDDVRFTDDEEPKPIYLWRRSRVEHLKKLRDAEAKPAEEPKPLKKRPRG